MPIRIIQLLLIVVVVVSCQPKQTTPPFPTSDAEGDTVFSNPEIAWTIEGLSMPESALYDEALDLIYVSNINGAPEKMDGNGFISLVSPKGEIIVKEWAIGLNGPKGMSLKDSVLYVADVQQVAKIHKESGDILQTILIPSAVFLNDIVVDQSGTIYVSDTYQDRVFKIEGDSVTDWLHDTAQFTRPNGLLDLGDELLMATTTNDKGNLYSVAKSTGSVKLLAINMGHGDGIAKTPTGFLVSSWKGEIRSIDKQWNSELILDTTQPLVNTADIDYIPASKLILVPTFFGHSLVAYHWPK